jgi:hypothetical protein
MFHGKPNEASMDVLNQIIPVTPSDWLFFCIFGFLQNFEFGVLFLEIHLTSTTHCLRMHGHNLPHCIPGMDTVEAGYNVGEIYVMEGLSRQICRGRSRR